MLFYMWGGQTEKWVRPVGVSLSIFSLYLAFHLSTWYVGLPALLYGFELTFGYGINSPFHIWLKDDEWVRDVYAVWCCIPVIIAMFITWNLLAIVGCLLIMASFQVRAGSLFSIGKYQFLIEDAYRSFAIGLAMSIALR